MEGMQTLDQSLMDLVNKGSITAEEALLHSDNPVKLRNSLEAGSSSDMLFQTSG